MHELFGQMPEMDFFLQQKRFHIFGNICDISYAQIMLCVHTNLFLSFFQPYVWFFVVKIHLNLRI